MKIEDFDKSFSDDTIYDLPRTYMVNKYGYYEEYAIYEININMAHLVRLFDDERKMISCFIDDLSFENILTITELIK